MNDKAIVFDEIEIVFGKTTPKILLAKGYSLASIQKSNDEPPITQCLLVKEGVCYGYLYFFKKLVNPSLQSLENEAINLFVEDKKKSKVKRSKLVNEGDLSEKELKKIKMVQYIKTIAIIHSVSFLIGLAINYFVGIKNLFESNFIATLIILFSPTFIIATYIFPKEVTMGSSEKVNRFYEQFRYIPFLMINFLITYGFMIIIQNM